MEQNIKKILEDLYALDESLKMHEKSLVNFIEGIIAARPGVKFDENFQTELRNKLMAKIEEIKAAPVQSAGFLSKITYPRLAYIFVGSTVVLAALLIVVADSQMNRQFLSKNKLAYQPIFGQAKIIPTGERAFGALSAQGQLAQDSSARSSAPLGLGEGAPAISADISAPVAPKAFVGTPGLATGMGGGGGTVSSTVMPIWEGSLTYKYVYKGEPLKINDDKLSVYRRIKGTDAASSLASYLSGINLGFVDIAAFSNAQVQSFSLVEDKDFGYALFVDAKEGTVNISENSKWAYGQDIQPLSPEKMLDDRTLISMANDFLKKYKINADLYGQPEVEKSPQLFYAMIKSQGPEAYVPEVMTVTFPLKVDGKEVLDSAGNKTGLRVSISIRFNQVTGLWSLSSQNYESSMYEAVQDGDAIVKLAELGGSNYYPYDGAEKTIEVEIGTPKLSLITMYNYRDGQSEELLVPAYVFPIIKAPEGNPYFQTNIVVPAVKEMLGGVGGGGDLPVRILK